MDDLVDRLRAHVRSRLAGSEPVLSNGAWQMMLDASDGIERLVRRNAALIEILRAKPCPSDARYTIAECQQCGCSEGLLVAERDLTQEASNG